MERGGVDRVAHRLIWGGIGIQHTGLADADSQYQPDNICEWDLCH